MIITITIYLMGAIDENFIAKFLPRQRYTEAS